MAAQRRPVASSAAPAPAKHDDEDDPWGSDDDNPWADITSPEVDAMDKHEERFDMIFEQWMTEREAWDHCKSKMRYLSVANFKKYWEDCEIFSQDLAQTDKATMVERAKERYESKFVDEEYTNRPPLEWNSRAFQKTQDW